MSLRLKRRVKEELARWERDQKEALAGFPKIKKDAIFVKHLGDSYAKLLSQELQKGVTFADAIAFATIKKAIGGSVRAAREIREATADALEATDWKQALQAMGVSDPDALIDRMADVLLESEAANKG